jgi:hypothetical protein
MVGLLSQVMDKVNMNVVKDNVGVLAVLAMHSVNMNKNIELRCAREVRNNVNVNNVYVVNEDSPRQVLLNQEVVNMDHVDMNDVNVDVNNVNKNVNNSEQVLLSQEVLPVNLDHVDVDVNAEAIDVNNVKVDHVDAYVNAETVDVNNVNVNNPEQVLLMNVDHVDVSREDDIDIDIVNAPRLKRTQQEKGENEEKVKEVKLDKETGDTLEKEKVNRVTEDACNNEDTEEESEKRDVMGNINPESSYDEVDEMTEKD